MNSRKSDTYKLLEFYCDRTFHKLIYFQKCHIDVNYTGPSLHILLIYSWFFFTIFTWLDKFVRSLKEFDTFADSTTFFLQKLLHTMLRLDATQKKRCLRFDFRFKKFRIKQAIFINDISFLCKSAQAKKKFEVFFHCFLNVF